MSWTCVSLFNDFCSGLHWQIDARATASHATMRARCRTSYTKAQNCPSEAEDKRPPLLLTHLPPCTKRRTRGLASASSGMQGSLHYCWGRCAPLFRASQVGSYVACTLHLTTLRFCRARLRGTECRASHHWSFAQNRRSPFLSPKVEPQCTTMLLPLRWDKW